MVRAVARIAPARRDPPTGQKLSVSSELCGGLIVAFIGAPIRIGLPVVLLSLAKPGRRLLSDASPTGLKTRWSGFFFYCFYASAGSQSHLPAACRPPAKPLRSQRLSLRRAFSLHPTLITPARMLRKKLWTPAAIALLGTAGDAEVAAKLACSASRVFTKRSELGIASHGRSSRVCKWGACELARRWACDAPLILR